jgi:glycosyltransferase involved in cell wall biosynthesis
MAKLSDPLHLLVPKSDMTIERHGMQVMHFTTQNGFLTNIPSIYHPHDLLHRHYPQYLSKLSVIKRNFVYKQLCEKSSIIATASNWVKQDLIRQYHIANEKIAVVPLAPLLESYPTPSENDLAATKQKFSLPDQFIYYPAQTWPHKNHIGLLRALSLLRDQKDLRLAFVSSGKQNEYFPRIQKAVAELNLEDQTVFLGYVSPLEVSCLYKLSHGVVIPTKFEAASFPLWEAFQAGVPVACSNSTSLPGQAGDAALIFDPERIDQIAESIWRLVVDTNLRHQLISNATRKIQNYSWEKTARRFRSLYRIIGGTSTSDDINRLSDNGSY